MIPPFTVSRIPEIVFGSGSRHALPDRIGFHGARFLLVRGSRSLPASPHWPALRDALRARGLEWEEITVSGEPSPDLVDAAVAEHRRGRFEVIVGIGGGSTLDAAKAIAGLLPSGRSAMDHLDDVGGGIPFEGPVLPFVAVPTTAGTGTEATRNAVLSRPGPAGFKKSFRHDALVARCAVVDPDFLESCPPEIVAGDGMDALTQLLESYASTRASRFTDALCESGLSAVREGLLPWYEGTGEAAAVRSCMAFASLVSGITLSQAGLGAVHGLAQPLGSFFPIPHGIVCGTLVAAATRVNVRVMRARATDCPALGKYSKAWTILSGTERDFPPPDDGAERLVSLLESWTWRLRLKHLSRYGVTESDLPRIVAASRGGSMRSNPVPLEDAEIAAIVEERI